uniref:N(4)-(Beta-n-acetylglucosaminyl)-l-asparaginase n=1 Tax=Riptortus pedestris TaxID=329032 RepID=R4WJP0_RIPPE|nr:n(4)-(beta-n-acetylglucosaminyl)-l-asparaginase [Riptortus pedestris]
MSVFGYLVFILFLFHPYNCHCQQVSGDPLIKKWSESSHLKRPSHFVLTTWNFGGATQAAYNFLTQRNGSAIDAVVEGCGYCEREQCDFTVGYGGSPDENGETTLEAMVFDGVSMDIGAVGGLKRIKNAIGVARAVLLHSGHSILVGDAATEFAKHMGFKEETLSTNNSVNQWIQWMNDKCQPNFWERVVPDPEKSCGPYRPLDVYNTKSNVNTQPPLEGYRIQSHKNKFHHDTIGQIVIDKTGAIVAGTSSNGAMHKIPGRIGDAAVPGAGSYADARYGAAVSTGDGDIMMRFSPSAAVVEKLKQKMSPEKATWQVIQSIREKYPDYNGAILAVNAAGSFAAACHGFEAFPFTVSSSDIDGGRVKKFYIMCSS